MFLYLSSRAFHSASETTNDETGIDFLFFLLFSPGDAGERTLTRDSAFDREHPLFPPCTPGAMDTSGKVTEAGVVDQDSNSSPFTASTANSRGLYLLFFHLLCSSLWTRHQQLSQSASSFTLLAFPCAHFATLLVGLSYAAHRLKGEKVEDIMRRSSKLLLGRNEEDVASYIKGGSLRRNLTMATATSCVVALSLRLWASRWVLDREMEALDVSV